jgi:hypothetical protein
MQCKFNSFTKKPESKTAFIIKDGNPIFTETLYLLNPIYIHKRSPAFTLVSKGKHVSGFFGVAENVFIGDHDSKTLLIFQKQNSFDLFKIDIAPLQARDAA